MILRFYKTGFKPEQNGVYEDIGQYLNRLTPVRTLSNVKTFGYFDLREVVRLDMDSHDNQFDGVSSVGDYVVAIDDAAEYPASYYYFVLNYTWKGKSTVELELGLDTLNSFWSRIQSELSPETHVTRQLRRRWRTPQSTDTVAYPIVDKFAEPFQVTFKQTSDTTIYDKYTPYLGKWYLVWSSKVYDIAQSTTATTSITPSSFSLLPETSKLATLKASPYHTLTSANIPCGHTGWFAITNERMPGGKIISLTTGSSLVELKEGHWAVVGLNEKGVIFVQDRDTNSGLVQQYEDFKGITFDGIDILYRQTGTYPWRSASFDYGDLIYTNPLNINDSDISTTWRSFKEWYSRNSTEESLVKIYEFPYCPVTLTINEDDVIEVDPAQVGFDFNIMVLNENETYVHNLFSQVYPVTTITKANVVSSIKAHYAERFEPKLVNSNYGGYTAFVYDASSWMVRPELMTTFDGTQTLLINQLVSPQSGGVTFTFTSDQQRLSGDDWFISSNRINELPVFNSEYVQYLKYGNALDQKRLNATVAQGALSGVSAGIGAYGTIALAAGKIAAGTAAGASSGSGLGPVGIIAGAVVGVATAAVNIGVQMSQQADQMTTSKRQMSNSASRASAINDLEIYDNLGYQCLRKLTYEPVTGTQPVLDFFHLYGYATDYREVPVFNIRYWYDYVQCEPVFRNKFTWQDREDDIVTRMKQGFYVYHLRDGTYDLTKEYENWESAIYSWAIN